MFIRERTLSIIKPDAVSKNIIGAIINRFEVAGFVVVEAKMLTLTCAQAIQFYFEHQNKHFFDDLIKFMTSGPIFVQILEGNNVVLRNREIMGATNPMNALSGTIRSDYGESCTRNAIHGSDSKDSARYEIAYFFDNLLPMV